MEQQRNRAHQIYPHQNKKLKINLKNTQNIWNDAFEDSGHQIKKDSDPEYFPYI